MLTIFERRFSDQKFATIYDTKNLGGGGGSGSFLVPRHGAIFGPLLKTCRTDYMTVRTML